MCHSLRRRRSKYRALTKNRVRTAAGCVALIFTVEYFLNEWHVSRRFVVVVSQFLRGRPSPEGWLDVPQTRKEDLLVSPRGPRRHTMTIKKRGTANKGRNDPAIGSKFDICCRRSLCPPLIYNSISVVRAAVISVRWNTPNFIEPEQAGIQQRDNKSGIFFGRR